MSRVQSKVLLQKNFQTDQVCLLIHLFFLGKREKELSIMQKRQKENAIDDDKRPDIFLEYLIDPPFRGRSKTTLTRRGGQVVPKCQSFVNVYKAENVNAGGQLVKKSQTHVNVVCERPLTTIPPEQMPTNHRFNKCFFVYTQRKRRK